MTWAIYATPEDWTEITSGFAQAGLTGGEWNRIKDYVAAGVAGWNADIPVPPEHPCYADDGPNGGWTNPETGQREPIGGRYMRVIVMTHGTKAGWLAEMDRLLSRPQRDRERIRFFRTYIATVPWYAVEWPTGQPPPASFWQGMTCT
jgi:hypothetical protein